MASACATLDAESDWQLRKSGALQATDFRDSELALYRMGIATVPQNVSRSTADSVTGGACLRINAWVILPGMVPDRCM